MRTTIYLRVAENRKDVPILPPGLVLCLTLISSNYWYPYLEHIFIVPKVFEPLNFGCIIIFHLINTQEALKKLIL